MKPHPTVTPNHMLDIFTRPRQSRLAFYAAKARKRATDALGRCFDLGVGVELGAVLWVLAALLAGVSWWLWLMNGGRG